MLAASARLLDGEGPFGPQRARNRGECLPLQTQSPSDQRVGQERRGWHLAGYLSSLWIGEFPDITGNGSGEGIPVKAQGCWALCWSWGQLQAQASSLACVRTAVITVLLAGEMLGPLCGRISHPWSGGRWGSPVPASAVAIVGRAAPLSQVLWGCSEAGVAQRAAHLSSWARFAVCCISLRVLSSLVACDCPHGAELLRL